MINRELFELASATSDKELQKKARDAFLDWCKKNGRTPLNAQSIQDWWKEDVEE